MLKSRGKKNALKHLSVAMIALLVCFLIIYCYPAADGIKAGVVEASSGQRLSNLNIGDRVVDISWEWEHRIGNNYSRSCETDGETICETCETCETKPVTWIVVAKDHYRGGDAGVLAGVLVSHVTLLSEEIIGNHCFDTSTNRGSIWGSNHWGNSGTHNAIRGIRVFLNNTFYNAMTPGFRDSILSTSLPNKAGDTGEAYTTEDKIFLPSTTEMNDILLNWTYPIGLNWGYFANDNSRAALFAGSSSHYLTRSPDTFHSDTIRAVFTGGSFGRARTNVGLYGFRPALNLASGVRVSVSPNHNGAYEIIIDRQAYEEDHLPDTSPEDIIDIYGDVDSDGIITVQDAILVLQHIVKLEILTDAQAVRADVDGNGIIDVQDAISILRYITGIPTDSMVGQDVSAGQP